MGSLLSEAIGGVVQEEKQAEKGNILAFEPPGSAPARPAGGGGLLSEALAPIIEEEHAATAQAFKLAETANPETYAKARALADRAGLPVDMVAADLGAFQHRETATAMNALFRQDPRLANVFREADNPKLVEYDDLKTASGIDWMLRAAGSAARQGYVQHVQIGSTRWRQVLGQASPDEVRDADALEAANPSRNFGAQGFGDRIITDTAEQITPLVLSAIGAFKGATVGMMGGAIGGSVVGGVGAAPGAVIGAGLGAKVGTMLTTTQMEAAGAYGEFRKMRDDTGKLLDDDTARAAAMVVGVINGGLETTGLVMLGKTLGPLKGGILSQLGIEAGPARAAVRAALAKPAFRTAITNIGKHLITGIASQVVEESAQEATTIAGAMAAQKFEGGQWAGPTFGEMVDRVAEAGTRAIGPALVLGGMGSAASFRSEMADVRRVKLQTQILQEMAATAPNMKLRERMPEKARELIDRVTANGPIDAAYINGEKLQEYFQSKGLAPDEFLPGLGRKLEEAVATKGDVMIHIGDYTVKMAGSDLGKALQADTMFANYKYTENEAKELEKSFAEAREAAYKQDADMLREIEEEHGPRERLLSEYQQQLQQAGVAPEQARLQALPTVLFLEQIARKKGITLDEAELQHGVQIRAVMEGDTAVYRKQDAVDLTLDYLRRTGSKGLQKEMKLALGQSLGDFIRERGGLQESQGELAARDAKKFTAKKPGEGMSFDDMTLAAWEAGYFPDYQERPDQNLLLASLDEELAGRPIYQRGETEETVILPPHIANVHAFDRMINELGLDINAMSNERIRAEIEKAYATDPDEGALYQRAVSLPMPDTFDIPRIPSAEEMRSFGRVEAVPFDRVIATQEARQWDRFDAGDHPGDLVAGFGDKPVAARLSNGMHYLYDGHHRVDRALHNGEHSMEMHVIDVKDYAPGKDKKAAVPERSDEDLLRELGVFFQDKEGDKRGSFQFGKAGSRINLFEARDLSTFLHEAGHWFLAVYQDIATSENAPVEIAADWEVIKKALSIGDDNVITTDMHEQWAKWTEEFFHSGEAPSSELARAFAAFASWLKAVYRSLTQLGENRLPADVRGVMERMLASDQEIEQQKQVAQFRTWFKTAEEAGMSEAGFAAYKEVARAATEEAKSELTSKLLQEMKRETTREWRERKKEVREEVEKYLQEMPVYQVFRYLQSGEAPPNVEGAPAAHLKLSKQWLLDNLGPEVLRKLPKAVPPIYSSSAGNIIDGDTLAEMFGFTSGKAMVEQLISSPSYSAARRTEVNKRMNERFGNLLNDQAARAQSAVESLHNERRGELLEMELAALNRRAGSEARSVPRDVARQIAAETIAAKPVAEATRNSIHERAEARAAKAAEDALVKGDFDAAIVAKKQQLMAHYMALESRRAREEMDKAVDYLSTFTGRKPPPRVDPGYVEQIQGLLERFDFKKRSAREIAKRKSFAEFAKEVEARGEVLAMEPDHPLLRDGFRKNYKDLSVDDVRAIRDAVKNLDHLGSLKKGILDGRKKKAFEAATAELAAQASRSPERAREKYRNPEEGFIRSLRESTLGLTANLLKIEQVVEWLDLGDINGPFRRMVWQRIADAQGRENKMQADYTARVLKIMESLEPGRLAERVSVADLGPDVSFTREELFAFALNTGNKENLEKMLKGETMIDEQRPENERRPRLDTQEKLDAALDHLSETDWKAIQEIWDTINSLWPEIAKLQKRLTGLEPKKVEARPFTNKHGTFAGGYYPLVYDPRNSLDAHNRKEAERADALFDSAYVRPTTSHGFTKERSAGYARPIATQLDVVSQHIAKVIHDVTHREAVADAYRLLNDPAVTGAIASRFGRPVFDEFNKWLKRIAQDKRAETDASAIQRLIAKSRANIGLWGLGFRISTVVTQFTGLFPSMEFVRPALLAQSLGEFLKNPWGNTFHGFGGNAGPMTDFVVSKSEEMRDRFETLDRDLNKAVAKLTGKEGRYADIQRSAFFMIGAADRMVAIPTWHGAYVQHLQENPGDDAGAVAYADRAVRLSQGAGSTKDIASVMEKRGIMAPFTMFYSYFNAYFNRLLTLGRDTRLAAAERDTSAIPSLVGRAIALTILPAIVSDLITGKWPDSDKEEGWLAWAAKKTVLMPFSSVPILRDAANAIENGRLSITPLARLVEAPVTLIREVGKGSEAEPRKIVKSAAEMIGMFAGVPGGQLVTTGNQVWRGMAEGDLQLRDFFFSRPAK